MISSKERGISMSRSRHSEAEIIAALKQVDAGRAVEDVAREVGVSKHTIYAWKAKYGGVHVLLRRNGERVSHKRVHRVYREAGLSLRRKKRKLSVSHFSSIHFW